ncbi:MAG: methyltransferase domain-containing protein [Xenococcaceae cyanobacterium MO_188.B29]|nr:methyltransferase domain-containing protein [Xenococcaceae cyanobacterium MO_188.B29]
MAKNNWNTVLYEGKHEFVWKYGEEVIELLAPQPGEYILDLGCGTGQLTDKIAATRAKVTGIDRSKEMIIKAKKNYPQLNFAVADATKFTLEQPLDAVFSNAVLHWIKRPEAVINCIQQALKPGGRFVAQFGGKDGVKQILQALTETLANSGYGVATNPWYFPSIGEYTSLLEKHGLEVTYAHLFDRPTPLESGDAGLPNWLKMFAGSFVSRLSTEEEKEIIEQVVTKLKPILYSDGIWTADYRPIRIMAVKCLN